MHRAVVALLLAIFCSLRASAQTTWTGAISTAWNTAGNWSAGVPIAGVTAIVPPAANQPSTLGVAGAVCGALTVQAGAVVTTSTAFPLSADGNVNCAGAVNGELRIVGAASIATTGAGVVQRLVLLLGAHSIPNAVISGDLVQGATAGVLTVQTCTVGGVFDLRGAGLIGLPGSFVDAHDILLLTTGPITTVPATMRCAGVWQSNANWQPTSGTAIFNGHAVTMAPGTVWFHVEVEAPFGTAWNGDLRVAGTLRLRGDLTVGGTVVDLTQRALFTFDALLDGPSVTQLRIRNGLSSAGVIDLPNAQLDADGDLTFFLSGRLNINGGTHTISSSLGMPGIMTCSPGATVLFDGNGTITASSINTTLPNVTITGNYTIRDAHVGGNLLQAPSAGPLAIEKCTVDGVATFQGNTVVNSNVGLLDVNGGVVWQTSNPVVTPPATIRCSGSWSSNGTFVPTSGLVEFDGIGAQSVLVSAFAWRSLRILPSSLVATALPVSTTGFLDVQGTLTTTGNDVASVGAITVAGTMTASASARVRGQAGITVSGVLNAPAARLDIDGAVTVPGAVNLGAGPHEASGSIVVAGALSIPAGQVLRCDGAGTIDIVPTSPIPNVQFLAGNYDVQRLVVGQDLTQTSGQLAIRSCFVLRDAFLQGAGIGDLAVGLLDIRRNALLQFSGPVTAPPATIRCGGAFTSTAPFAPATGLVVFDGIGLQNVVAPSPWHDLAIESASVTALSAQLLASGRVDVSGQVGVPGALVQIGGDLFVGPTGSLVAASATTVAVGGSTSIVGVLSAAAAALAAGGDVVIDPTGSLSLGAGPHTFQGSFDAQGALAVPGGADFQFFGVSTVSAAPTNQLPTVLFAGTAIKVTNLNVTGAIRHTAGRLTVGTLTGLATAQFQGLTVEGGPSDQLDVAGNITFATSSVVVTPPGLIRCGGSWSSSAQFLPTSGVVEMYGTGPQTISSAGVLFLSSLRIVSNLVNLLPADAILQHDLIVAGTLTTPGGLNVLEVRGDLSLSGSGAIAQSGGVITVAGSVTNQGTMTGSGALRMVGAGTLSGSGVFGALQIAATGEIQVGGAVALPSSLALSLGTLRVPAGASLTVGTDLLGTGGSLRGQPLGVLDVNGNVSLAGVQAHPTGVPDLRCAGNWAADSAFVPTSSTVFLDGSGALQSLLGPLSFRTLDIAAGTRTVPANLTMSANAVAVRAGATLDQGARSLRVTAPTVQVQGDHLVAAGGELFLGTGTAYTVAAGGRLALIGLFLQPARVDGPVGPGYALTVDGTIEAVNFEFAHMGPAGIRIAAGATIAAAPRDLRGGTFSGAAAAPGSCLLHIDRSAPAQLRYVTFLDAGSAAFNIRSTGTAQIGIVNDDGNFTGVGHEDDPSSRIDWLPAEHTIVTRATADAAVHRTETALLTSAEFDVHRFHIARATALAGPYVDIAGSPLVPLGSPVLGGSYALTDFAVTDTTKYFYRIEEELTHGARRVLGADFARPWPQQIGNVWFVGTNGGYPDIAAAVAAAAVGGNIVVQAGTYPAFTLNKAVRIAPDGSGPVVIDTAFAPFVVRDIPANAPDLGLFDLRIGAAGSPFGMQVVNCDNTIVLDGLQIATANGTTGLLVDDTAHIAVQNCQLAGDPGVRFANAALGYLARGAVDELVLTGSSQVTRCGVVPGAQTVGVGSSVLALPGVMPDITYRATWPGEKVVPIAVTTAANSTYALFFSFGRDFFNMNDVFPFIDMVLLIEQTQAQGLALGFAPTGADIVPLPAPFDPATWGLSAPLQLYELKQTSLGRMSNSRSVILVP